MWTLTSHSNRTISLCALFALSFLCVSTSLVQAQETFTGQWLLEFNPEPMPAYLTLRHESDGGGRHDSSQAIPKEQLQGLSQAQVSSDGSTVRFQIKREAGSLHCEGWFKAQACKRGGRADAHDAGCCWGYADGANHEYAWPG